MKFARFFPGFLLTFLVFWGLSLKLGETPPLGYLLNPYEGFLQQSEKKRPDVAMPKNFTGLKGKADIVFDDMMVPHIFAENDEDLYFLQGYVTAYFRLWQMDMITRAASGRLSEIVGEKALLRDRYMRRIGMVIGAEKAVEELSKDTLANKIIAAYTNGVNAYIQTLGYQNYPIEFKLLNYEPEPWTPLKTALLLKYMAYDLSGKSSDKELSDILQYLGNQVVQELFPDYPILMDPIHPQNPEWKTWNPTLPKVPAGYFYSDTSQLGTSIYEISTNEKNLGSNNFVVGGSRTLNGYPILANDPHLKLNFPSIWFQIQLKSPTVNVVGVSLPGAPNVIIGYNENIAWGVTNVAPDIFDYYKITFKDASRKEYLYNGQWKPIQHKIDTFFVYGKGIFIDTLEITHLGPIVDSKGENFHPECPKDHALRWLAHDPSYELLTFYYLNRAQNLEDYRNALKYYSCPAQNFIFASKNKDIALTSNGKYPLKWKGQGKFTLDGSKPEHEWQGWIPFEHNPYTVNPPHDYLASANQFPTDTTYPYFLHWEFASFERGKRIHDRLKNMYQATVDSLRLLQLDTKNMFAEFALPSLLNYLDEQAIQQKKWKYILERWNYFHEPELVEPTLFTEWYQRFHDLVWDEFTIVKQKDTIRLRTPEPVMTVAILKKDSENPWFDLKNTPQKETARELLIQAWNDAVNHLNKKFKGIEKALWYKYRGTKVTHLAMIPAFSSDTLLHGGGTDIVNALGKTAGPSWRMVVQLTENIPQGYGVYPAGQSGNPGSKYYDNMLPIWLKGELVPILFLQSPNDKSKRILSKYSF